MDERKAIVPIVAYSAAQVAALVGYSDHTINAEARAGRLRSFLPNGTKKGRVFLGRWVLDWLESGAQGGPQRGE